MGGRHVARTWLVVALVATTTPALAHAHASGGERASFEASLEAGDKCRQHPEKREVRRPPAVAAKLDVVPWVQPQSGGVTIAGWF